jgi:hypothetical protein
MERDYGAEHKRSEQLCKGLRAAALHSPTRQGLLTIIDYERWHSLEGEKEASSAVVRQWFGTWQRALDSANLVLREDERWLIPTAVEVIAACGPQVSANAAFDWLRKSGLDGRLLGEMIGMCLNGRWLALRQAAQPYATIKARTARTVPAIVAEPEPRPSLESTSV